MSITCRGLTAAGLALATATAVGLTSPRSAGAATIAAATIQGSAPIGGTAHGVSHAKPPPPPLRLDADPAKARVPARTGAPVPDQPLTVPPRVAPKGYPPAVGAPPPPPPRRTVGKAPVSAPGAATGLATPLAAANYYFYGQGSQVANSKGVFAHLTVAKPQLAKSDSHSLAEISAQSTDGAHVVEVGWTVDRTVNPNQPDEPHLFVFYWVDHTPAKCYNCGFVLSEEIPPEVVRPGGVLPANQTQHFAIQFFDGDWWIGYGGSWLGYFPGELWGGRFTRAGATQWFGEVASYSSKPCTDMGNGRPADDPKAAAFTQIGFYEGPAPQLATRASSSYYSVKQLGPDSFRFGGPGAC